MFLQWKPFAGFRLTDTGHMFKEYWFKQFLLYSVRYYKFNNNNNNNNNNYNNNNNNINNNNNNFI